MEVIYYFILFIWSILCLILFAKVWSMTNDIRTIKNILLDLANKLNPNNNGNSCQSEPIIDFEEGDNVVNIETGEEMIVAQIFPDGDVACKPVKGLGLRKLVKTTNLKKV